MKCLLMWLITIVASVGMETVNELRYFKDAADQGYKINFKKLNAKKDGVNAPQFSFIRYIIPFFNMMTSIQKSIEYTNNRDAIFNLFKVLECLEEMSEEEKKEYAKKPTALNAFLVPLKLDLRLQKANTLTIPNENGENSVIYFEFDKKEEIIILKTMGAVSKLSVDEQKNIIKQKFGMVKRMMLDKEFEEMAREILDRSDTLEIPFAKTSNPEEKASRQQYIIEELNRMRDEFLKSVNEDEEDEKGHSFIKKM